MKVNCKIQGYSNIDDVNKVHVSYSTPETKGSVSRTFDVPVHNYELLEKIRNETPVEELKKLKQNFDSFSYDIDEDDDRQQKLLLG